MNRLPIPGGWYVDALLSGEWVACRHADLTLDTWKGPMQPQDRLLFPTLTTAGGVLRIAGIAHGESPMTKHLSDRVVEWAAPTGWDVKPYKACGPLGIIYDANGLLRASDCGPGIGSDGFRCLDPNTGAIIPGQVTLQPANGVDLYEWTPLGGGFIVGQGPSDNGAFLYDPTTNLYHEVIKGKARFIKARRAGDAIVICCWVEPGHAEIVWATIDEIRATVPPVSTPRIIAPYEAVVRINRPLWFGFFEFVPSPDLPSNCRVPVVQGAPWLDVVGPGWRYVSGHPDGDLDAIEAAIGSARGGGARVLAYVTRLAVKAGVAANPRRYPTSADIQGIEAYLGATETDSDFITRIAGALALAPRAVLIAQCYTSNTANTSDLRRLPGLISILARSYLNVVGILVFSGSGRATGWQDHPEVHGAWRELYAGITGTPLLEAPTPPDEPSTPEPAPPSAPEEPEPMPQPVRTDTLGPDGVIEAGGDIRSLDGVAVFTLQGDSNIVLYVAGAAVWDASTVGRNASRLVMQQDGNLVALDGQTAVWDSGTVGHSGASLRVLPDAAVIVNTAGEVVWRAAAADIVVEEPDEEPEAKPRPTPRPSLGSGGLFSWLAGLFKRRKKQQAPLPNTEVPPAPEPVPPPAPLPISRPRAVVHRVGASDYQAIGDPRVDLPTFAMALGQFGMRHTRVWLIDAWATGADVPVYIDGVGFEHRAGTTYDGYLPFSKRNDGKWDLFDWRADYFARVRLFADEMNRNGIVPVFTLLELYSWADRKQRMLWVPDQSVGPWRNNVNGVRWGDPDDPTYFSLPDQWLTEFVSRVCAALNGASYVIETGNEMPEKEMHVRFAQLIPIGVPRQTNRQEDTPGQYENMMKTGVFEYVALHGKADISYLDENFQPAYPGAAAAAPDHPDHGTWLHWRWYEDHPEFKTFRTAWPTFDASRIVLSSDGCRATHLSIPGTYRYDELKPVALDALARGASYEHQTVLKMRRFLEGRYDLNDLGYDAAFLRQIAGA